MTYMSTEIASPMTPTQPVTPTVNAYQTPEVQAVKPTINTANTGYVAPTDTFKQNDINTGLLEFDGTAGGGFTGNAINNGNIGANVNQATPDFKTADNYLTDGAFVENRVNSLTNDPNNQLMQRGKAQGLAEAGTRGLQNTTMGATIGQTAVIDKALQIVTPDATTQAASDMSRQNATYQAQRANQDTANAGSLAEQTVKINSELNNQNAANTWDSNAQKATQQAELNKYNADIAGAAATQKAQYDADARTQTGLLEGASKTQAANISAELAGMESMSAQNLSILQSKLEGARATTADQNQAIIAQFQAQQEMQRTIISEEYGKVIAQAQLNVGQRDSLANAMTTMAKDYEVSIQNIMLDPNLTSESKNIAISRINQIFNQDMRNISNIFGADYTRTTNGYGNITTNAQ